MRLRLSLVLAVVAGSLALPAFAGAHAVLEQTQPERGASLERSPEQVTLEFNEPVEASFGAVRVYDSQAARVDTGELTRPDDRSNAIAAPLEPDLPDGIYTATYRVVSADSHPISGGFVFTVGDPVSTAGVGVDELIDEAGTGAVTDAAFGVARVASYAGTAIVIGTIVFVVVCWGPAVGARARAGEGWQGAGDGFAARARGLLILGLTVGAIATAAGLVLQGAVALGDSFWAALSPGVIADVVQTRFGTAWALRLLDFALLAGLCLAPRVGMAVAVVRPARLGADGVVPVRPLQTNPLLAGALAVCLGYLVLTPALAGHPGVTDPTWLSVGASFIHVLAFACWLGGLATLLFAVPAGTSRLSGPERTSLLAGVLDRFSALALLSVAALLATGIVQSVLQLAALSELFETGYGRAIVAKAVLLAALVVLGAFNRRRSLPAIRSSAERRESPGRAGVALRRTLRMEVGLIAGALVATAVLAASAPSAATQEGPFSGSAELGPARVEVTVDPASVGSNEVHLYLFDGQTGAQYDRSKELTVDASLPAKDIAPVELDLRKAGPGHYVVRGAPLGVPGDWQLELAARVSAFEEYRAQVEVPVR